VDTYQLPTPESEPHGVTVGSDGNVWVALEIGKIAQLTPMETTANDSPSVQ
jgi:virginiamycin B lyase